jgi:heme exporter protein A
MNKLQVQQLSYVRQTKCLFKCLSFTLSAGESILIEGANGSGKSSLLRVLSGMALPTTGQIDWKGQPIHSHAIEYTHQLHYIGHANGMKLGLTVAENLRLAAYLAAVYVDEAALQSVLSLLHLSTHFHTITRDLSAGQKRRLALAKLLLIPKPLWLLDEPFTALDHLTQTLFLEQLKQHLSQGGISLWSTHQPLWFQSITPYRLHLG